jgi:hypothetical protein
VKESISQIIQPKLDRIIKDTNYKIPPLNQNMPPFKFTDDDLLDFKFLMTTPYSANFNSNVIRIALNAKEEAVAATICSKYSVKMDDDMILRAIKTS